MLRLKKRRQLFKYVGVGIFGGLLGKAISPHAAIAATGSECRPCSNVHCIRTKLAQGENVLVRPGDYDLGDEGLTINKEQSIIGMGAGVRFFYSGSGAAIACNTQGVGTSGRLSGFDIFGFGNGSGIRIGQDGNGSKSAQMRIDNIMVTGFTRGIECIAAQICRFINITLHGNSIGLFFDDRLGETASNTQCLFSGLDVKRNDEVGVLIHDLVGSKFEACNFEGNGEEGVCLHTRQKLSRIINVRFDTCWFEDNNQLRDGSGHAYMKIEHDDGQAIASFVMLASCWFGNPPEGRFQLWIDNAEHVLFDNNRFVGGESIFTPSISTPPRILTRGRAARNQSIKAFGPVTESVDKTQLKVHFGDIVEVTNSLPTTISSFTTFWTEDGDTVIVRVNDSNTVFLNGVNTDDNLRLSGGLNYAASQGDVLTFLRRDTNWIEIGRFAGGIA